MKRKSRTPTPAPAPAVIVMKMSLQKPNTSSFAIEDDGDDDRLSTLTDSLLITILSLLPIKSAAATSALSRRWRHLWTHITHLRLLRLKPETVEHILRQLTSPKIHELHLHPSYGIYGEKSVSQLVNSCFNFVYSRNVEVFTASSGLIRPSLVRVPDWVFKCQSLVTLCLDRNLVVDVSKVLDCINLPNLKCLSLFIGDDNSNLMRNLVRSCPLLESLYLYIQVIWFGHQVDITSPNLTHLYISVTALPLPNSVMQRPSCCQFVINTPRLLYLDITDYFHSSYYFVENPTALLKACIYLVDNSLSSALRVIQGVSSATRLSLSHCSSDTVEYLGSLEDGDVPIFNYVIDLILIHRIGRCCWRKFLFCLRCFPKLEDLSVRGLLREQDDGDALQSLPVTLLSTLKRMTVSAFYGSVCEVKLLEYILNNADMMERLEIYAYVEVAENEDRISKERDFCELLFKLPRRSSTCVVKFNGLHIYASSNNGEEISHATIST